MHVFVIITPEGDTMIVDKQSVVYCAKESVLNEALDNDEPIMSIHPALCQEYNLHGLLLCGVNNENFLDETRP